MLLLPIVFSVLMEAPVHATEEHISELFELSEFQHQNFNITFDDPIDRSNTLTDLEPEEFVSSSLSVAELSTPEATTTTLPEEASTVPDVANHDDVIGQVTSVSQLSDVQPSDWAYQALQGLVERYGCIAGYPDGTFQGQSALTRYEFAAGLNACLDRISELIAATTADLATQEDLATLQRLQEEFAAELATLRGRVDSLEARAAELEESQFSTTTILHGNAIFAASGVLGESADNNQIVGRYRLNLSTITSFTGRDFLLLSMFAGNAPLGEADQENLTVRSASFDLPGVEVDGTFNGIPVTVGQSTSEGTLSSEFGANTNNELKLFTAGYSFPVGDRLNVAVLTSLAPFQIYAPTLNPYLDDMDGGTGAISVFGEYNPIYTLSGGGTGVVLNYQIFDSLKLTGGYLADGLFVGDGTEGRGLFNGGYAALGQLTWNVTDDFSIAAVYTNEYAPSGRFGFNYNGLGVTGTAVANSLAGQDVLGATQLGLEASPVITNGYGVNVNWQPSSRFSISGWFSTFYPRLIGEGDGNILTYALTFAFPDLGQEGNLLGLVVGAEPYLTEMGGNPQDFDVDVPLHIEAFYRHRIGDRIFLTPGIIWLTAPNQDRDNGSDFIATLRTTFTF
ncbi:iron uptake porin [Egbenema bharatensis]|uniref:iron uptake porin n=1 Tax=Egbenema bharatensis TaxID=3463334 RepID=UPI003A8988E6